MSKYSALKTAILMLIVVPLVLACVCWSWYAYQWKSILAPASYRTPYPVEKARDDTVRVLMIGDSWAELHSIYNCDTVLCNMLSKQTGLPVSVISKGRGGALSRDVYHLMFRETTPLSDSTYCTEDMLRLGADYCVVVAGINDAAANLGADFYCRNYMLILRTLFTWKMRPVVIEIPDVDIKGLYGKKPLKDKLSDQCRAWMTGSDMYDVKEYRGTLQTEFVKQELEDSIVYVPCCQWNKGGGDLFATDNIHLNRDGYRRLDSCIAVYVAKDISESGLFEQPVSKQP